MPEFRPVSKEAFGGRRWRRPLDWRRAAGDAVAPLVVQELPKAAMSLPVGFVQDGPGFTPVAVQGLAPGRNLFVAPDGRWLGGYVPAAYRGYPFALAAAEGGQQLLCVDVASGLVSDTEGEPFFGEDGGPGEALKQVLDFLSAVAQNRQATQRVCGALARHALIQPWPIKVRGGQGEQAVQGLFRVDEAALNALAAPAFEELRQAGALPVAYCQLLSMQHLPRLGQLAQAHAAASAQAQAAAHPVDGGAELNLDFLGQGGTITFGNQ